MPKRKQTASTSPVPRIGTQVETTAVINQVQVGPHKDKLSFTSLNLVDDQNQIVADLVKHEKPILLTIDLEGPPDASFPPIQQDGLLKGFKIAKTCDAPDVTNIQFSSDQIAQLAGYVRGAHMVKLIIGEKLPDPELFDNE